VCMQSLCQLLSISRLPGTQLTSCTAAAASRGVKAVGSESHNLTSPSWHDELSQCVLLAYIPVRWPVSGITPAAYPCWEGALGVSSPRWQVCLIKFKTR
jgi:hypothetical protein